MVRIIVKASNDPDCRVAGAELLFEGVVGHGVVAVGIAFGALVGFGALIARGGCADASSFVCVCVCVLCKIRPVEPAESTRDK
mmetsp:Transcript_18450/g.52932  ORF Transcript_18450/g.52932 Transcript_18450/m.52932 type:complete len:83 (-) Transcript_18450:280-528(-)